MMHRITSRNGPETNLLRAGKNMCSKIKDCIRKRELNEAEKESYKIKWHKNIFIICLWRKEFLNSFCSIGRYFSWRIAHVNGICRFVIGFQVD
jgi:hypothetical protein